MTALVLAGIADGPLPVIVAIVGFIGSLGLAVFWRPMYETDPLPLEITVRSTAGYHVSAIMRYAGRRYEIIAIDRQRRRLTLIPAP